ncbi:uncharacterized protein FIBRA_08986 [Fibroporia radiculosa]|uniref:Uncharacterized protein n=1 Tax=Fibroporia radiculosa TaxID=599839 RepID=J4GIN2_9APHY|nr:uncharacterized protein FIBRA_08986 [Fibroporia radiculosa]CCM06698.1 predicted protein [Fibroporia radiculosa]
MPTAPFDQESFAHSGLPVGRSANGQHVMETLKRGMPAGLASDRKKSQGVDALIHTNQSSTVPTLIVPPPKSRKSRVRNHSHGGAPASEKTPNWANLPIGLGRPALTEPEEIAMLRGLLTNWPAYSNASRAEFNQVMTFYKARMQRQIELSDLQSKKYLVFVDAVKLLVDMQTAYTQLQMQSMKNNSGDLGRMADEAFEAIQWLQSDVQAAGKSLVVWLKK